MLHVPIYITCFLQRHSGEEVLVGDILCSHRHNHSDGVVAKFTSFAGEQANPLAVCLHPEQQVSCTWLFTNYNELLCY